jgi:hypothetical protein
MFANTHESQIIIKIGLWNVSIIILGFKGEVGLGESSRHFESLCCEFDKLF